MTATLLAPAALVLTLTARYPDQTLVEVCHSEDDAYASRDRHFDNGAVSVRINGLPTWGCAN